MKRTLLLLLCIAAAGPAWAGVCKGADPCKACKDCSMTDICGLRYHYAMFDIDPPTPERCKEFYSLNVVSIKHLYKLKEQPTLLHHLGVQQ